MNALRNIITVLLIGGTAMLAGTADAAPGGKVAAPKEDREFWVKTLVKIADPVLVNLANGKLKQNMPCVPENRAAVTHLEAVGRLVCGIAPWLELGPDNTPEGRLRKKYINLTINGLAKIVDPDSPDMLNFDKGSQPLVDAAFLAQGLCRAPNQLWGNLDGETRQRLVAALKSSRKIKPNESNWLLFATMVEAALLEFTGECDRDRLAYGINRFMNEWYKGDGHYGDGPAFHMDYYNSFVIHPMLYDSLAIMKKHNIPGSEHLPAETTRFTRYAEQQERLISPEGTYPVVGRSIAYRFGAFQVLAQAALLDKLPKDVSPGQVRSALTAVIRRQMGNPANFDRNGWLQTGFVGAQPGAGEYYISTGSLYLCSAVLLPLGLPASHPFWTEPYQKWTSKKAWEGDSVKADHAIK